MPNELYTKILTIVPDLLSYKPRSYTNSTFHMQVHSEFNRHVIGYLHLFIQDPKKETIDFHLTLDEERPDGTETKEEIKFFLRKKENTAHVSEINFEGMHINRITRDNNDEVNTMAGEWLDKLIERGYVSKPEKKKQKYTPKTHISDFLVAVAQQVDKLYSFMTK